MKTSALVLFDVDETLLITGGASSRCIERASKRVLGERFRWGNVVVGQLDPEIFLDLAEQCGIKSAAGKLDEYKAWYLAELKADLLAHHADVKVMPGIHNVLANLSKRRGVTVGLLTGNFRDAVTLKLEAADINPNLFRVGAFAEDGASRRDLVAVAIQRMRDATGANLPPRNVILVGDTPRDISCARETGTRVLAVATGKYSLEQLNAESPDRAVRDLTDPSALDELIAEMVGEPFKPPVPPIV